MISSSIFDLGSAMCSFVAASPRSCTGVMVLLASPWKVGLLPAGRVAVSCGSLASSTSRARTWNGPNRRLCRCRIKSSNAREVLGTEEAEEVRSGARRAAAEEEVGRSRPFLSARNEEELLSCIRKEVEARRLPSTIASGLEELYYNYKNAVLKSEVPGADEIILSNMAITFDRILLDVEDPYTFLPYHRAIREPFDYYIFGQNYIRPLIDFRRSYVGNISLFNDMEEKLRQGHNIVLMSNHQTEADPAVVALLLERTNPDIAESMVFVAGDRVLTDPLCKPFSMGRNLLCVYSKKHMDDVPELAEVKRRANTRSLKEMAVLLRNGSQILWIAPSGGRDRPDRLTGEWYPAPFDASSVDNMRRLVEYSGVPGHIYPLALLCYEIMPPPLQIEKQIGERRTISFHGVGVSIAPEINKDEISAAFDDPDKARDAFSQAVYASVLEQYGILRSAIYGTDGINASNSKTSLSQPWQ